MPEFLARNTDRAKELRNSATPPEKRLWFHLRNRKLAGHKFSSQMPIGPYFCDFLCRVSKRVIEVDGQGHDQTVAHDTRRTIFLQQAGYQVIRFSNLHIMNELEGVLKTIELALADRPPPNPSREREGRMETIGQQRGSV